MERQAEAAFRVLQSGRNTGKVVTRIPYRSRSFVGSPGTHVVSGGTGGLGLLTARWLSQVGAASLALKPGAAGWRLTWAASGSSWRRARAVQVLSCDSAEAADASRLAATVQATMLPLRGVWHAAGVLSDALLSKQSAASLRTVYGPKAEGATLLQLIGATSPLDAFTMFSSVSALLGGQGQGNYAAANSFLTASAEPPSVRSCRCQCSVTGWGEVGMASRGAAAKRLAAAEASGFGCLGCYWSWRAPGGHMAADARGTLCHAGSVGQGLTTLQQSHPSCLQV